MSGIDPNLQPKAEVNLENRPTITRKILKRAVRIQKIKNRTHDQNQAASVRKQIAERRAHTKRSYRAKMARKKK